MNKIICLTFFAAIVHFGCKNHKAAETIPPLEKKHGLEIDSSVKTLVIKEMKDANYGNDLFFAKLDIEAFENDKPVNRSLFTGNSLPHYAAYFYNHDTLTIMLTNIMGGSFGFVIEKYKDSCRVSHAFSLHEATTGSYKLNAHDSIYQKGLMVPCKFNVILNQQEYKNQEPVYGFVDAISNDYFIRSDSSDIKSRIEFKGYFKAMGAK